MMMQSSTSAAAACLPYTRYEEVEAPIAITSIQHATRLAELLQRHNVCYTRAPPTAHVSARGKSRQQSGQRTNQTNKQELGKVVQFSLRSTPSSTPSTTPSSHSSHRWHAGRQALYIGPTCATAWATAWAVALPPVETALAMAWAMAWVWPAALALARAWATAWAVALGPATHACSACGTLGGGQHVSAGCLC